MPKIKNVIKADRSFNAEKDILSVMDKLPDCVWSTSLEDLTELARLMMDRKPSIYSLPAKLKTYPPDSPVTLNSRFKVKVIGTFGVGGGKFDTPTLRTVRDTLLTLFDKGLICRIELHGGYYASFKRQKEILKRIERKDKFEYSWDSSEMNPDYGSFEKRAINAEVDPTNRPSIEPNAAPDVTVD